MFSALMFLQMCLPVIVLIPPFNSKLQFLFSFGESQWTWLTLKQKLFQYLLVRFVISNTRVHPLNYYISIA